MGQQTAFGAGSIFVVPTSANPTPLQFGIVQDVSVDFTQEIKSLYGQQAYPNDAAIGKQSIKGTIKTAIFDPVLYNQILFGQALTSGENRASIAEAGAVPSSSPYTVTSANAATFATDLGVTYASTGQRLTRVSSGPTAGQYSLAAGVYTFATADASAAVVLNYTYSVASSAGVGSNIVGGNPLMGGVIGQNQLILNSKRSNTGAQLTLTLYAVQFGGLKMALKNDDFTVIDLPFEAYMDTSSRVFNFSMRGTL